MVGVGWITVELTFLSKSEGGRNNPPMPPWSATGDGGYMPHLVVIDGDSEYLGVRFVGGPYLVFGEPAVFNLSSCLPEWITRR